MQTNNIELENFSQDLFNTFSAPLSNNNYDLATEFTNNNQAINSTEQLLFIDSQVAEYQTLIDDLTEITEVIILDAKRDGIEQITESIQQYDNLATVHIVSHGDVGQLSLGNSLLNQNTLPYYQDYLTSWSDSLRENADILLYGCNVAADPLGREFVESLSRYTQADISASTDLTGNADLGGDWDLEYAVGEIDAQLAFQAEVKTNYEQILFDGFSFSPPSDGFNNDFSFDSFDNFDNFDIDDSFTFDLYDPFEYDLDFDFGIDNFVDYSDFDYDSNDDSNHNSNSDPNDDADSGFDLNSYDFSNPQINSEVLDFTPAEISFNSTDFDFDSLSIDNNSISFKFNPAKFNSISSQLDFLSQLDNSGELKLAFEDYNFNFNSLFSFESDQVTIGTTGSNTIKFEYDPASFNFTGAELFRANANLFDYKFLDSDISLINDEIPFVEYNASDYRALEYAFTGDELFDPQYYLGSNIIPDGMNPFTDYIENGYRAGRNPSALFNVSYYLSQNSDVRIAGVDPLGHYARFGYAEDHENRNPSAVFNNAYYNENNSDVVDEKMPSLLHYILFGDGENLNSRDPNPAFNNSYYNQMNPDVAKSDMTALGHYMLFGWKESRPDHPNYNPNRNPSAFLNSTDYFVLNNDVLVASYEYDSANPLQHLLEFGFGENRLTHQIFESKNITKITKVVTPDSDPQEISNLKQSLKQDGYNLTVKDDKTFKISSITFIDEDGDFNLFEPVEDALEALFVGAVAYTVYKGGPIIRGIADGIRSLTWQDVFEGFSYAGDALMIGGYVGLPINKETSDTLSINYGDPELEDLLSGTRAFPGQTESERLVEIFTTPKVDGLEDFTILPEDSGIFIPTTTRFPQGDPIIEDILNDGLFLGGDETVEGAYVLAIDNQGIARGLRKFGSLTDKSLTPYERTIGESLVAEGNQLISVDDDNVRKTLGISQNSKAADYLSVTPSGRFNLTEVKGASPGSAGADIEGAIIQLNSTYNALIKEVPGAKLGKVEIAVPEGAPFRGNYELSGNQIVRVTSEGTEVVRIGGTVVTIRR